MRRKCQPSPVFLPGEFHGERSLVGCSSWGCEESGTPEATERMHAHTQISHLPLHFLIFLIGSSNWLISLLTAHLFPRQTKILYYIFVFSLFPNILIITFFGYSNVPPLLNIYLCLYSHASTSSSSLIKMNGGRNNSQYKNFMVLQ